MSDFLAFNQSAEVICRHDGPGAVWAHVACDSEDSLKAFLAGAAAAGVKVVASRPRTLPERVAAEALVFVDIGKLCDVIDYSPADQVIGVGAGISLADIEQILAKRNQWWPVMAADPSATLADVIAGGDGGCLEHGFGGPRDLVLGMTVALSSGAVIKCGGRVVKNVTGYDIGKLFIGSRGWLGVVTAANLRLYARPAASCSLLWSSAGDGAVLTAARRLLRSGLPLSCLEIVDGRVLAALANSSPELERFCQSISSNCSSILLTRVDGHAEVVEEVSAATERSAGFAPGSAQVVSSDVAEVLWRRLSNVGQSTTLACLEASLNLSQLESLFATGWADGQKPLWQARPGRGRLRLYAADAGSVADLLSAMKAYALTNATTLSVAYGDGEYEYRVEKIPSADACAGKLKAAIKERFDPLRSLNPLVLF